MNKISKTTIVTYYYYSILLLDVMKIIIKVTNKLINGLKYNSNLLL